MKRRNLLVITAGILVPLILSACGKEGESEPTRIRDNTEVMPQNVIQLGDDYEYTPVDVTGHFLCKITDARIITDPEDCPPKEYMESSNLRATVDGERVRFPYEEWFTEGGAYDHGCRLVMVELTVTNVNAQSPVSTEANPEGYNDPYRFAPHNFVRLINLADLSGNDEYQSYQKIFCNFCSPHMDAPEDDPATDGQENVSFRVQPGETVTFTMTFPLNTNQDGTTPELSMLMLSSGANTDVETGLFIDLELGDD